VLRPSDVVASVPARKLSLLVDLGAATRAAVPGSLDAVPDAVPVRVLPERISVAAVSSSSPSSLPGSVASFFSTDEQR